MKIRQVLLFLCEKDRVLWTEWGGGSAAAPPSGVEEQKLAADRGFNGVVDVL